MLFTNSVRQFAATNIITKWWRKR